MFWPLAFLHHLQQQLIPLRTSFTLALFFKLLVLLKRCHTHIKIDVFFSIFYVALCQKVSFWLRLSFQTASPVFHRFSSFSWQSGQNRMFLALRWPSPWLLLLSLSYGIVGFASPIAVLADSFVRFARSGAVLADSLVRIAFRRLWERPPGTSKTVPGLPEARNRVCGAILQRIL